jgi:hypothetical protein
MASKGLDRRRRVLQNPHSWVPCPAEGPRCTAEGAAQRSGREASHRRRLREELAPLWPRVTPKEG